MQANEKQRSVSKSVEFMLDQRPFIKELFAIDAVNYSGLARHLLPSLNKSVGRDVNVEGVIMAVKRYAEKAGASDISSKLLKAISKCDLRLKGDIVDFTLKKTSHNYEIVLEAQKNIKWEQGDMACIYQSLTEIAVILDRKNAHMISRKVPDSEIINRKEGLAMITLKTPSEFVSLPGVFHFIFGKIASEGIVLIDTISTFTELVIIVREEDAARAYEIIFELIKSGRN